MATEELTGYIFPHPKRTEFLVDLDELNRNDLRKLAGVNDFGKLRKWKIFADDLKGNQDPFVWNKNFLNSYCKKPWNRKYWNGIKYIIWVSSTDDGKIYCDLVMLIKEYSAWENFVTPLYDGNLFANRDHYARFEEHTTDNQRNNANNMTRTTLKGDSDKSFQPLDENGELIEISDILRSNNVSIIKAKDKNGKNVQNNIIKLYDSNSKQIYEDIIERSAFKIKGNSLAKIRAFMNDEIDKFINT
ncbi:hypothetical protein [Weissella kandleri]|nr:hypothetical protein [Weissella kandleri]